MAINLTSLDNMPRITTSAYASQAYAGDGGAMGLCESGPNAAILAQQYFGGLKQANLDALQQRIEIQQPIKKEEVKMADPKRRLVKVIIVDPDDRVPLDKCVLHSGQEKLTDLTDQELFFEIDIKTILDAHNTERTRIVDKTIKERKEHLEPVKVRDLRMVVVTVAQF